MSVTRGHPIATRAETIQAILGESERPGKVPFRNALLQGGTPGARVPGPFAQFLRRGRESAWEQYALLMTWASGEPHDVRRDSRIWARAVGLADDESGRAAVSRNWGFLRDLNLITVERKQRLANVTLLREDGSGEEYHHPGQAPRAHYFQLPFAYWAEGYHETLSFAAKGMLLVALSLPDDFALPAERAPGWYGISESTVRRGFRELREGGLLVVKREERSAPLAPKGYTLVNHYKLQPPFGPKGRHAGASKGKRKGTSKRKARPRKAA